MSASFSRTKRWRIEDLQKQVDLVLEIDRRFFQRQPDRTHRLRLAARSEVRMIEEVHGPDEARLPRGERWFCCTKSLDTAVGARIRLYIANADDSGTDLPEAACQWIFNRRASNQVGQVEASIFGVIRRWRAMH